MTKSLVFISHISEEREIAIEFKLLIEEHFPGLLEVFVSSDGQSIKMGQKWLDNVSDGLKQCNVEIVICSPMSVARPWINFEAGAGWIRDIPVIPLCHSGISPSDLPVPLNLLQAAKATDVSGLKLIFPVLASAIGAKTPAVDFTNFIEKITEFELQYTFWTKCNEAFGALHGVHDQIIPELKKGQSVGIRLPSEVFNYLNPFIHFLASHDILKLERLSTQMLGGEGVSFECAIIPLQGFTNIANDPRLKF